MAKNEHFIIGLLHTLSVIFFLGGIFLDYYDFTAGLFVLIAVSIFTNFLRQHMRDKPRKENIEKERTQSQTKEQAIKTFCIQCGAKLEGEEYCPSCGTFNDN